MVGGGFGGSAIALIDGSKVASAQESITSAFESEGLKRPRFFIATPEEGARLEH